MCKYKEGHPLLLWPTDAVCYRGDRAGARVSTGARIQQAGLLLDGFEGLKGAVACVTGE